MKQIEFSEKEIVLMIHKIEDLISEQVRTSIDESEFDFDESDFDEIYEDSRNRLCKMVKNQI